MCGTKFPGGYNFLDGQGHRCIVYKQPSERVFWQPGDALDGKKPMLWVYDLESANEPIEQTTNLYETEHGLVSLNATIVQRKKHSVNLVVFKNVFTEQDQYYYGDGCLFSFLTDMLTINEGNNVCIAHNGSGYDTRLVFEETLLLNTGVKVAPVMRGTKIIELHVGKTCFRDSMLHLPGSLKNLAKSFDLETQKGYFPHLFNTRENNEYIGPIPDKAYYDLTWVAKSNNDVLLFDEWYETQAGVEWNFKDELLRYCRDDVKILGDVVKRFHDICTNKFRHSPWLHATGPSYVHSVIVTSISNDDVLRLPDIEDEEGRRHRVTELAEKEHWAVLHSNEYFFARKALRGGRTDVRCVRRTLTQEEKDRGCKIVYQDMVSMYPAVQLKYRYPVGTPKIHIFDLDYWPCKKHRNPVNGNDVELTCDCTNKYNRRDLNIFNHETQPTLEYLHECFGVICVSLEPPKNLYHPALVTWDKDAGKCIGSLETITAGVFTTPEFQMALYHGYRVLKVHRFDEYHFSEGLWNPFIKDLYIEKMAHSGPPPSTLTEREQLVTDYEQKFGMGELVANSFHRWKKDPALRLVFKIMLNSGWGKHCQRPMMPQTTLIDANDQQALIDYFENVEQNKYTVKGLQHIGDWTYLRSDICGTSTNPDLHSTYLPAGLFVPSYGRMELYAQLSRLGRRVLYHDTDSVVYVYDPEQYNIPLSDVLGEWSEEDISKEGIEKFIAIGPKSYGIKTVSGKTMIKVKGLSVKHSLRGLVNFDKMEGLLDDHFNNTQGVLSVPQMNFNYAVGRNMQTTYSLKQIWFKPKEMKGDLHDTGYVFPKGFCELCKNDPTHCL
jgi:hypothetical protein